MERSASLRAVRNHRGAAPWDAVDRSAGNFDRGFQRTILSLRGIPAELASVGRAGPPRTAYLLASVADDPSTGMKYARDAFPGQTSDLFMWIERRTP